MLLSLSKKMTFEYEEKKHSEGRKGKETKAVSMVACFIANFAREEKKNNNHDTSMFSAAS